jgi:hypothetical protein
MADTQTLFSKDGQTRIQFSAWIHNYLFYKSIGTEVQIRRQGTSSFLWWSWNSWNPTLAKSIQITNQYSGLPGALTQGPQAASNTDDLELKQWAAGVNVHLDGQGLSPVTPGATLDLRWVTGRASVMIADGEAFSLQVATGNGPPPP